MVQLTDEILMALADGELDARTAAEVKARLEHDPQARETLRLYRESAGLARAAFETTLKEPVPDRLLAAVEAEAEEKVMAFSTHRRGQGWFVQRAALPLAASVALFVGLGLGYGLSENPRSTGAGTGQFVAHIPKESKLFEALETTPSGQPLAWRESAGAEDGSATPILTFRTADARYCREFRLSTGVAGEASMGLACRGQDGAWRLQVLVATQRKSAPSGGGVFRPAGGAADQALEALVDELADGPALDAADEADAIARGWAP